MNLTKEVKYLYTEKAFIFHSFRIIFSKYFSTGYRIWYKLFFLSLSLFFFFFFLMFLQWKNVSLFFTVFFFSYCCSCFIANLIMMCPTLFFFPLFLLGFCYISGFISFIKFKNILVINSQNTFLFIILSSFEAPITLHDVVP